MKDMAIQDPYRIPWNYSSLGRSIGLSVTGRIQVQRLKMNRVYSGLLGRQYEARLALAGAQRLLHECRE